MAQVFRNLFLASALYLSLPSVQAHMEMRWPYSFRSKFNPNNTDPDYSNTSPLLADGSNYPCKGYQDLPSSQAPVVSYIPGQTYNLTLSGEATHGGGSCQISLSYDDGKTFHVIKSMIGGCPLKDNWDFTIPSYAPPSQSVILAWTWFNLIGNREMYMQCARVAVTGQAVQRYRRTTSKRQSSIDQLPENFACNINNGCTTIEDHEVIFPNPGNVIERGTDLYSPLPGPGYTLTTTPTGNAFMNSVSTTAAGPTATGSGSGSGLTMTTVYYSTPSLLTVTSSTSTTSTPVPGQFFSVQSNSSTSQLLTTSTPYPNTTLATTTTVQSSTTTSTITSASASATLIPGACVPGTFTCDSSTSFSQCVSTIDGSSSYIFMGQVASGMQCTNGTIMSQNDGPCTPDGQLQCNGSQSFYLCTNGGLINMGPVAPGTTCSNGVIVSA